MSVVSQREHDLQRYKELPFQVMEYSPHFEIRKFDSVLTEEETKWHRDAEDRLVRKVEGEGWFIQLENQLPQPFRLGQSFFIPAGTWHRVIKAPNATELIVQIHKRV